MWKLHRYIATTVLLSSFIIFAVMCGLYIIFTFVAEMSNIGQGDYGSLQALIYVLLTMPSNIYLVLPIVGLLGSLMGLSLLANHSELIAMRAAGVSIRKISQGVLYSSLLLCIITFFIGSYAGPELTQYATIKRAIDMQGQAVLINSDSTWLKQGNDFIFIGHVDPNGKLTNVSRYRTNQYQLTEVDHIGDAVYQNNRWQLQNISVTKLTPTGISKQHFPTGTWDSLVTPALLNVLVSKSGNLSLPNLWSYINYRKLNGLDTASYELTFWQAFFQPLSVVLLALLAVPFVFGPLRSVHVGLKIIAGTAVGFLFFIINQFFGPLTAVYDFPPFLGAMLPTLIFSLLLAFMVWRIN